MKLLTRSTRQDVQNDNKNFPRTFTLFDAYNTEHFMQKAANKGEYLIKIRR